MTFPPVRVSPDPRYVAEVVVLLTTLGAKRSEFNAGKRARDLLEIKRVHHKIVDFNRDARQAGTGEAENQAIQKLMVEGKLQTGENDDLILPQIFIDGQYIGDANSLQGLEDDKMLEDILLRRTCMKCNDQRRAPDDTVCRSCGAKFDEILPGMMTIEQTLRDLAMATDGDYDEDYDGEYDDEPADHAPASASTYMPVQKGGRDEAFRIAGSNPSAPAAAPAPAPAPAPAAVAAPAQRAPAPVAAAAAASSPTYKPPAPTFKVGEQVQYWSDTKNRWVDACVEAKHERDGVIKYDLNCKRGAPAEKLRRPVHHS